LPFPEGEVYALRFSRDGRALLAAGGTHVQSGTAILFDSETGKRLGAFGDEPDVVLAADLSPDAKLVAIGGPRRIIKVFDTKTGTLRHTLKRHTDWVLSASYSPDGLLLATCDRAGNTFVWEAESGAELHALRGHNAAVISLAWDATGDRLFTGGDDGLVNCWDMHKGTSIGSWRADEKGVISLASTFAGALATSGRGGNVRFWTDAGREVGRALGPFDDIPALVAPVADARWAVADWSGRLSLWDASGKRLSRSEPILITAKELSSGPATIVSAEEPEPVLAAGSVRVKSDKGREIGLGSLGAEARAAEQTLSALLAALKDQRRRLEDDEAALRAPEGPLAPTSAPRVAQGAQSESEKSQLENVARLLSQALAQVESLAPCTIETPREWSELVLLTRLAAERARSLAGGAVDPKSREEEILTRLETTRRELRETLDHLKAIAQPASSSAGNGRQPAAPRQVDKSKLGEVAGGEER
jgi:hypothetical protein